MNAPYDGDRGPGTGGDPAGQAPSPPPAQHNPYAQDPYTQDGYNQDGYTQDAYRRDGYAQDPHADAQQQPPTPYDQQHAQQQQQAQNPYARDPYVQEAYQQDPYWAQGQSSQDPVTDALHDRAAHAPQGPPAQTAPYQPGDYQDATQQFYQQPQQAQPAQQPQQHYGPDPRIWAQSPPPGPAGPGRRPGASDPGTAQFTGVDDLVTRAGTEPQQNDAFAHLYRDQHAGGQLQPAEPEPEPETAPAKPAKAGSKASGLLKSSAVMAAGTIVSRLTGFLRTLVMAAAIGVGTLNDTYQVANTLPTMIYVLVGGGALNAVFIPQLVRAMKNDDDGGEAYANRLLTLVVVLLAGVTTICVLGAPLLIRVMSPTYVSHPDTNAVAIAFARYCLPTMFFMGVHVVMGQILNARGRFGAMMWTPVLNNIIVISTFGAFIWAYGTAGHSGVAPSNISPEGVRLLGIGTLLGLTVQALSMIPYLRQAGFKIRLRFDWRGHGLGKAAGLAKWTFFFVLANQLGLIVVTELATWAGTLAEKQGQSGTGIAGYNNALLLWQMPQAIITVSIMTAVLPRIARSAADGDTGAVRDDISYGLRTSAVAIVPCAFAFVALGVPLASLLYAAADADGARNIGFILMAFGLGLIPYSVQYVVLRGFYAYEDTRTPFYNTVIVAAVNAAASGACALVLPHRWAVVGMAGSYGLAYAVGVGVAWRRLKKRMGGDLDGSRVVRTYARLCMSAIPAAVVAGIAGFGLLHVIGDGAAGAFAALLVGGVLMLAIFYVAAKKMRIEELNGMVGMVRGRLGR
ncbi:murein biosynthesis integral membrane protein MurJ [Streptomyces montanisoli]|uniref:Murein biosynthesis integral membrane protein MurJ n=1 Tax=Streptomyces montanisoli TaxID=2798581 RepID=A0A940MJG1_9ACTN|nr:murein biosynthesis integral membrane protein MurJ [Streptomyces montanisoli]MBP0460426.1 murein biosynthesis integral membrane protein MurJ [Streptomyces montanisoli]